MTARTRCTRGCTRPFRRAPARGARPPHVFQKAAGHRCTQRCTLCTRPRCTFSTPSVRGGNTHPDHLRGAAQKVAAVSTAYARPDVGGTDVSSADDVSTTHPTPLLPSGHYRIGTPPLAAPGPSRPRACAYTKETPVPTTAAGGTPAAVLARPRARQAPTTLRPVAPVVAGTVTGVERDRLAAGLGALLRDARRVRGWSATHLAARIGAAASTVHRLERGTRRPRPIMLRHLADALTAAMTPSELVVIGMALEALKKPEAEARKRATQAKPGQRVGAVPENPTYEKGNHPSPDLAAEIEAGRTDVLAEALYAALVAAAGPSLAEDTPGGVRRRQRRARRVQQAISATEFRRRRIVYEAWLRDQAYGFGSRRFEKAQAENTAAFDAAVAALDAAEAAGNTAAATAALDRIGMLHDADPTRGVLNRRDWWSTNLPALLPDQEAPHGPHAR